jgi:Mannosyltransferase putative
VPRNAGPIDKYRPREEDLFLERIGGIRQEYFLVRVQPMLTNKHVPLHPGEAATMSEAMLKPVYLPCECKQSGRCPRFGREMPERDFSICRAEYASGLTPLSAEERVAYLRSLFLQAGRAAPRGTRQFRVLRGPPPPALSLSLPCVYRGDAPCNQPWETAAAGGETSELRPSMATFPCKCPSHAHDPFTTDQACEQCADYVTRLPAACNPIEPIHEEMCPACMISILRGPPQKMPLSWGKWKVTHDAHRLMLDHAAATVPPYINRFVGRGIVIGAGGAKFFACAMAVVGVLRRLNCQLPVEFWHLGPSEFDPQMQAVAEEAGIRCVDACEVRKDQPVRILNGFELKPYAVLHSAFREVMYIDADSIPARDPTYLFDEPKYRDHGAIFWPDIPSSPAIWGDRTEAWLPSVCWENFGLRYRDEPAFETGQMVIDKERCWQALHVTMHVNEHSDWYYQFIYGDKDTFHLSWRMTDTEFAMPDYLPGGAFPGLAQHDFSGRRLFQHCTQAKEDICERRHIDGLLNADMVVEAGEALHRRWGGAVWRIEDQTAEETALMAAAAGRYRYTRYLNEPQTRVLQLDADGRIGEGAADCEIRWTLRLSEGKPLLVIVGLAHKRQEVGMMLLRPDGLGGWRGRWEVHERCEVKLERVDLVGPTTCS